MRGIAPENFRDRLISTSLMDGEVVAAGLDAP
jgi:hypothetical protein